MGEHSHVGSSIKNLVIASAPEREDELHDLWARYSPVIKRTEDKPNFFCEGGAFGIIKFTGRSLEVLWLLGFASWKAFHAYSVYLRSRQYDREKIASILDQERANEEYRLVVKSALEQQKIENLNDFEWPQSVPLPQHGRPREDEEVQAVFDLICMAGAFLFLHEIRHVMLRQDNIEKSQQDEEMECDDFAVKMLLENVDEYALSSGYSSSKVKTKRAMSICLALFLILISRP